MTQSEFWKKQSLELETNYEKLHRNQYEILYLIRNILSAIVIAKMVAIMKNIWNI